jgi:ribosome-binding factor A
VSTDRITRINELLRREIAEDLFRVLTEDAADLSAVTVTHVVANRDLRTARVWVSVRGDAAQHERVLRLLKRHRAEIQERINQNLVLKYTPRLTFTLDTSVEQGDRVLGLLAQMEHEGQEKQP